MKGTVDKGMILQIDESKGIECYTYADFVGGWNKETNTDPTSVLSRAGYIIFYKGCHVTWKSKMEREISLSTTEAEYISLSQAMRDVIPFMHMSEELNKNYDLEANTPKLHCTLFEDNNGAIQLARTKKYRPRTKHIAIKYHRFRKYVQDGVVSILPIDTKEQIADVFTKPLSEIPFTYLRKKIQG